MDSEIVLDTRCAACSRQDKECEICDGVGFIPTANGNEILKFIKRHLKLENKY